MLKDLLSGLDREQLQALLLQLAEREPALIQAIEELVGASEPLSSKLAVSPTTASPRRAQVDAKAIRRQVRSILHSLDRMRSSEAYWHVSAVVNEVRRLLEQGWTLIQADDGRSALALLEAITEVYVSDWTNLNGSDGEASGFFQDLGPAGQKPCSARIFHLQNVKSGQTSWRPGSRKLMLTESRRSLLLPMKRRCWVGMLLSSNAFCREPTA